MRKTTPVKRLAKRWFKHHDSKIPFYVEAICEDKEYIGSLGDEVFDWRIDIFEKHLKFRTKHYQGTIPYEQIVSCEKCVIYEDCSEIRVREIYTEASIINIKSLNENEIAQLKKSENGVSIHSGNEYYPVLIEGESVELIWEINSYLCDFIRRVTVTRAWDSLKQSTL